MTNDSDINIDDEFDRILEEFINKELQDVETTELQSGSSPSASSLTISENRNTPEPPEAIADVADVAPAILSETEKLIASLCKEEQALFNAYSNFINAIIMMCEQHNKTLPEFSLFPDMLLPRYKPHLATQIKNESLSGWSTMLEIYPERLQFLTPGAADEELLNFAEKEKDELLQLAIISYVEVLIEMESCDIAYENRRIKAKKKYIERQIREEHEARQQKIQNYIKKIEHKRFPINAEKLVINYFKTAKKDPNGAYQILVNNPATFAPIETDKIPDKFFGLIKSKPEDGIKINRKIGNFMKNLKA